jgi:hypothetical protein
MHRDKLRRNCVFASSGICGSQCAFRCFWEAERQHTLFMLGWDRIRFDKKRAWTCYAELVFLQLVRFVCHVVHSSASRAQNVNALFFMLGWDRYKFDKKRTMIRYTKLVFLHPVGSAGHLVYSDAFGEQNIDTLFFMLLWAWCGFYKKRTGTRYDEIFVFASGGICKSHSTFRCVWGTKYRRNVTTK